MIRRLLLLSLILGCAHSMWAQCTRQQIQACQDSCGPMSDVGKINFVTCMKACQSACVEKPPVCKGGTGGIFPRYYVLGLVYAPPGCSSTSSLKCSAVSSVDYGALSSMGTKVSAKNSFSANVNVNVDVSFLFPDIAQFFSAGGGYETSSSDSASETVTKGINLDVSESGNGDGVDHDQDQFILLLNPAVAVQETQQTIGNTCSSVTVVNWWFGMSGSTGTQDLFNLYVEELKNPSKMRSNVAAQLQALGFTTSDYQTILSLDPFWNGSTTIDRTRFIPTLYAFPYEPPLQDADCNNGVCSCMAFKEAITNQLQTDVQHESETQYSVSFKEKLPGGFDVGIFNFGPSSDQKFTWTSSSTTDDMTSNTQSATATVVCPSPNYTGPVEMVIYWDTLFGSFLFVPTVLTPQTLILDRGTAADASGRPVRHEPVTLAFSGKTYHTWTNNHGEFVFFRPAGLPALTLPKTGQLLVRGKRQVVPLRSAQKLQIRVQ